MADNWIKLDEIELWDDNPNMGDVGAISEMIKEFGFRVPVGLFQDGITKDGNHRVRALLALRDEKLPEDEKWIPDGPCIRVNGDGEWEVQYIDNSDLDDLRGTALGLALNRAVRLGHDDIEILATHLMEIRNDENTSVESLGYEEDDLDDMLKLLTPKTLDQLKEEYGEVNPEDFWPIVKAKLPPDIYQKFQSIDGEDDTERLIYLLENL